MGLQTDNTKTDTAYLRKTRDKRVPGAGLEPARKLPPEGF